VDKREKSASTFETQVEQGLVCGRWFLVYSVDCDLARFQAPLVGDTTFPPSQTRLNWTGQSESEVGPGGVKKARWRWRKVTRKKFPGLQKEAVGRTVSFLRRVF